MIDEQKFLHDLEGMLHTEVQMSTDLLDIDEWDSFSLIAFLSMMEEKHGLSIPRSLVAEAVIVQDLFDATKSVCSKENMP